MAEYAGLAEQMRSLEEKRMREEFEPYRQSLDLSQELLMKAVAEGKMTAEQATEELTKTAQKVFESIAEDRAKKKAN